MKRKLSLDEQFEYAEKAMNGDMDAWGVLYEAYFDVFKDEVFKRISYGTRDAAETAEDLTSEIFEEIHDKLKKEKYDFENSFSTFIWHFSAKFKILKYWGKKNRFTELPFEPDDDKHGYDLPSSSGPGIASEDFWELFRIISISSAKPHQIIVFLLSTVLQISYNDIESDFHDLTLVSISHKIRDDYLALFPKGEDMSQYEKYFEPLFGIMNMKTEKIYKEREYSELRKNYTFTGEIILNEFFGNRTGNDLSNRFSDWCYDTRVLVWEKMLGLYDICFLLQSHGRNFEPHKIIACCYMKLLKEKSKSIAKNSDGKNLSALTDSFYEKYFARIRNGTNDSNGKEYLKPLYDQLEKKFEEVYFNPEYSVDSEYAECKNKKTGSLQLENFYNDCFKQGRNNYKSECLKKWSDTVRNGVYKRVKQIL